MDKKGIFITLEGGEGSGKSTLLPKLKQFFEQHNYSVTTSKEPGGTAIGTKIRRFILDACEVFQNPSTELLLFIADRLEHIKQVLQPALNKGDIVICDRYIDSTYAYQIGGRKLDPQIVETLSNMIPLIPDLTLLLDLDPQKGLARAAKRSAPDRFEKENINFHQAVRNMYLQRAKDFPERIKVFDTTNQNPEEVFNFTSQFLLSKVKGDHA